ncbi:hypothetical protein ACFT7S_12025 [Streptomyces sp. NPDC057136]|uniref:hypothetical protein n=1 Tax=Streptomyces sp. NPDC057136 TaxID=3346029 RepID=UPI00362DB963
MPADRDEAAKEALRALDALMPLAPWRTAMLSSAFPVVTADNAGARPSRGTPDELAQVL